MVSCGPLFKKLRIKNEYVKEFLGEFTGTMVLLIFGAGVLGQHILGEWGERNFASFLSVSLGWGMAIYLGVLVGGRSGRGNINPAITLALAITGRLQWRKVPLFFVAQYLGAFCGAFLVFVTYYERIYRHEWAHANATAKGNLSVNFTVTEYTMDYTGHIFVTRMFGNQLYTCVWDQFFATALLAGGVLAIVDRNNFNFPEWAQPLSVGLLVYAIVGCFALNAGAALNPARDFGPRVMMFLCGWGWKALTDGNYYLWVPIAAPHVGAIVGMIGYDLLIGAHVVPLPSAVQPSVMKFVHTPQKSGACSVVLATSPMKIPPTPGKTPSKVPPTPGKTPATPGKVPPTPAKSVAGDSKMDLELAQLNPQAEDITVGEEVCIHLIPKDEDDVKLPRDSIVADQEP